MQETEIDFLKRKQIIENLKKEGFDTDNIWYHVSNVDFKEFDINKSQDGCIWLTRDLDSIKNGDTGASLNSDKIYIHKFYIKTKKIAGWEEEDKYMTDQLIQEGYDAVLLDDDIKIFNPSNIIKVNYIIDKKEEFNNETVFYHGNENKIHRFSELVPSFFSTDKKYSEGYGNYVYEYNLNIKKPFNTSIDEKAREYYNNVFLKDELGQNASYIKKGEHISFVNADNFWAFISVEEEIGKGLGYDSIVVKEFEGELNEYNTNLSVVPLNKNQINPIQKNRKKNKIKP